MKDEAEMRTELPDTTAYGYGLLIEALVQLRKEYSHTEIGSDAQRLIHLLEGQVDQQVQVVSRQTFEEGPRPNTPSVFPEEDES